MKLLTNKLGRIIAVLAAVALLISAVAVFSPNISGFFSDIIDTTSQKGIDMLNSISNPANSSGTSTPTPEVVAGSATFDTDWDGVGDITLTWEELKSGKNTWECMYDNTSITDTSVGGFSMGPIISIVIPDGVQILDTSAFADCTALNSVTIPSSLTNVSDNTFLNCPLTSITFNGTKSQWDAISFDDGWHDFCPETTVICTDETFKIPLGQYYS